MSSPAQPDDSGVYRLEAEPPQAPKLPNGHAVMKPDSEDLHYALGADLMMHAHNCVRTFGDFHLALSGGSTPMPFYMRLMVDPAFRSFPWKRTHLWIVDERCVPNDDERSNYKHISEYLLDHSDMPRDQAHPVRATDEKGPRRYERELEEALGWRERGHDRLDFVLLGVGSDGHTASLFPNSPALNETERLVVGNDGPEVTPPARVTMTYRLINASRFIAVLVTGKGKREIVERVRKAEDNWRDLPILGVKPQSGVLRWYLDEAACPEA